MTNKSPDLVMKRRWLFTAIMCAVVALAFSPRESAEAAEQSAELYFTILHTNDEHSALLPHSPAVDYHQEKEDSTVGGLARLATAIEGIRNAKTEENEPVLLFNAGDFLGGSAFGWLAPQGHSAELSLLQAMGYDAVAIGNHEYDYGPDVLAQYLDGAGYPDAHEDMLLLATNTLPPDDHPLAAKGLFRRTGLFKLENGLTVGVFGLIGKDAIEVTHDTGRLEFLDQHQEAQRATAQLKDAGADVIVAITHSGVEEDKALALAVPEIDVIIGGHSHDALQEPVEQGDTLIVQAGSLGRYLGRLELAYNPETGRTRTRNHEGDHTFLIPIDGRFAPHPKIESIVREYTTLLNTYISEVTGGDFDDIMATVALSEFVLPNHPPLKETPMANFVTDAMRLVTEELTGEKVHVAIQANGSIRDSIIPGSLEHSEGEVSFYDIAEVVGLGYGGDGHAGYPIVSAYLTGEELYRLLYVAVALEVFMGDSYFLQFSGLRFRYRPAALSVIAGELYTGEGVQPADGSEGFVSLRRGDRDLYHVVTDAYVYSFLPLAAELLPHLTISPKNAAGEPIPPERMHELFVRHDDARELKVWETVITYAANQPPSEVGIPQIPDYYADTSGRIVPER